MSSDICIQQDVTQNHTTIIMRTATYLYLSETENKTLDALIRELGFASRTEYFTACAHVAIYGPLIDSRKNPGVHTTVWIEALSKIRTATLLQQETFFGLLHEIAFPAVAVRGADTVLPLLGDDLKAAMLERCASIPTDAEMEEWIKIFENIYRPELIRYRTTQYREKIAETFGAAP